MPKSVAELVADGVDLIVAPSTIEALAAKRATNETLHTSGLKQQIEGVAVAAQTWVGLLPVVTGLNLPAAIGRKARGESDAVIEPITSFS